MGFNCQRCAQPLLLDASLKECDDDKVKEVKEVVRQAFPTPGPSTGPTDPAQRLDALGVKRSVREALLAQIRAKSKETKEKEKEEDAQSVQYARLFRVLAALPGLDETKPIQHPLCDTCTQQLLECMATEISDVRQERDTLQLLERELTRLAFVEGDMEMSADDKARWQREQNAVLREIEEMEAEKRRLEKEIAECDHDEAKLQRELRATKEEEDALEKDENAFWKEYNEQMAELEQIESQTALITTQLENDKAILAQLEKTNAFTDVFSITEDARGMPSINGLRLGRLGSGSHAHEQVEWPEINAAWGQTALLLTVLARKLDCTFTKYAVHPRGSYSTVERLEPDKAVYELYGTSDWQIGRLLHSRRFDYAMSGILHCVEELCERAVQHDASLDLPHKCVSSLTQNP